MRRVDPRLLAIIASLLVVGLIAVYAGSKGDANKVMLLEQIADLRTEVESNRVLAAAQPVATERITSLVDDGGAWHTSLFLHDDWQRRPEERQLRRWFGVTLSGGLGLWGDTSPTLAKLWRDTHRHIYTPSSAVYQARFRALIGDSFPAILISDQKGNIVYLSLREQGASDGSRYQQIPGSTVQLVTDIRASFGRFRERLQNKLRPPQPKPEPAPAPVPDEPDVNVVVPVNVQPDIGEDKEAPFPTGLLVGAVVLAIVVTLVIAFLRDM